MPTGSSTSVPAPATTAASPALPKRQDIALHLVLVPDNVTRGVALVGYLLAMGAGGLWVASRRLAGLLLK